MPQFVVLSGPSCVGKGPLYRTIRRLNPKLPLKKIVLHNDRKPRLGEVDGEDYIFSSSDKVLSLPDESFIKVNLGSDEKPNWQALDLGDVRRALAGEETAFLEAHFTIVAKLNQRRGGGEIESSTVFMSPLSRSEIEFLKTRPEVKLAEFVTDVMRRKLLRRTARQKGVLSLPDLEDIEKRAGRAPKELSNAHLYDYVIPNHDGEDSDNWEQFYYPVGDAQTAYRVFEAILSGEKQIGGAEKWDENVFR